MTRGRKLSVTKEPATGAPAVTRGRGLSVTRLVELTVEKVEKTVEKVEKTVGKTVEKVEKTVEKIRNPHDLPPVAPKPPLIQRISGFEDPSRIPIIGKLLPKPKPKVAPLRGYALRRSSSMPARFSQLPSRHQALVANSPDKPITQADFDRYDATLDAFYTEQFKPHEAPITTAEEWNVRYPEYQQQQRIKFHLEGNLRPIDFQFGDSDLENPRAAPRPPGARIIKDDPLPPIPPQLKVKFQEQSEMFPTAPKDNIPCVRDLGPAALKRHSRPRSQSFSHFETRIRTCENCGAIYTEGTEHPKCEEAEDNDDIGAKTTRDLVVHHDIPELLHLERHLRAQRQRSRPIAGPVMVQVYNPFKPLVRPVNPDRNSTATSIPPSEYSMEERPASSVTTVSNGHEAPSVAPSAKPEPDYSSFRVPSSYSQISTGERSSKLSVTSSDSKGKSEKEQEGQRDSHRERKQSNPIQEVRRERSNSGEQAAQRKSDCPNIVVVEVELGSGRGTSKQHEHSSQQKVTPATEKGRYETKKTVGVHESPRERQLHINIQQQRVPRNDNTVDNTKRADEARRDAREQKSEEARKPAAHVDQRDPRDRTSSTFKKTQPLGRHRSEPEVLTPTPAAVVGVSQQRRAESVKPASGNLQAPAAQRARAASKGEEEQARRQKVRRSMSVSGLEDLAKQVKQMSGAPAVRVDSHASQSGPQASRGPVPAPTLRTRPSRVNLGPPPSASSGAAQPRTRAPSGATSRPQPVDASSESQNRVRVVSNNSRPQLAIDAGSAQPRARVVSNNARPKPEDTLRVPAKHEPKVSVASTRTNMTGVSAVLDAHHSIAFSTASTPSIYSIKTASSHSSADTYASSTMRGHGYLTSATTLATDTYGGVSAGVNPHGDANIGSRRVYEDCISPEASRIIQPKHYQPQEKPRERKASSTAAPVDSTKSKPRSVSRPAPIKTSVASTRTDAPARARPRSPPPYSPYEYSDEPPSPTPSSVSSTGATIFQSEYAVSECAASEFEVPSHLSFSVGSSYADDDDDMSMSQPKYTKLPLHSNKSADLLRRVKRQEQEEKAMRERAHRDVKATSREGVDVAKAVSMWEGMSKEQKDAAKERGRERLREREREAEKQKAYEKEMATAKERERAHPAPKIEIRVSHAPAPALQKILPLTIKKKTSTALSN